MADATARRCSPALAISHFMPTYVSVCREEISIVRTKSFSPSTSFAVLCTVPSLLGGFSRCPSLAPTFDALVSFSSKRMAPLTLPCLSSPDPFSWLLAPLLPFEPAAALDLEPPDTFWTLWGVITGGEEEGSGGMLLSPTGSYRRLGVHSENGIERTECFD